MTHFPQAPRPEQAEATGRPRAWHPAIRVPRPWSTKSRWRVRATTVIAI